MIAAHDHHAAVRQQRPEHVQPEVRQHPRDEREHRVRRGQHDPVHDPDDDVGQHVEDGDDGSGLVARDERQPDPDHQREEDHLQHLALRQRLERVRRHDVQDHLPGVGRGRGLGDLRRSLFAPRHSQPLARLDGHEPRAARLHDIRDRQADRDGERGRAEVDDERLDADASEFLQVVQAADAHDEREEHDRHGDETQKPDEQVADEGVERAHKPRRARAERRALIRGACFEMEPLDLRLAELVRVQPRQRRVRRVEISHACDARRQHRNLRGLAGDISLRVVHAQRRPRAGRPRGVHGQPDDQPEKKTEQNLPVQGEAFPGHTGTVHASILPRNSLRFRLLRAATVRERSHRVHGEGSAP
ncbi:MAG TPA: hypothetical protein PLU35_09040 [Phycisphaerales bacterium]|nr:hypothetical protein [Phycisphaerales bacterium]